MLNILLITILVVSAAMYAVAAYFYFWMLKTSTEMSSERERTEKVLERLTRARKNKPLVFISYTGADKELADECEQYLLENNYEIKKYNPDELWDDPATQVIETIETANALIYVAGQKKSDWIKGEILFANRHNIPFLR